MFGCFVWIIGCFRASTIIQSGVKPAHCLDPSTDAQRETPLPSLLGPTIGLVKNRPARVKCCRLLVRHLAASVRVLTVRARRDRPAVRQTPPGSYGPGPLLAFSPTAERWRCRVFAPFQRPCPRRPAPRG